jgi:hypothetical protein
VRRSRRAAVTVASALCVGALIAGTAARAGAGTGLTAATSSSAAGFSFTFPTFPSPPPFPTFPSPTPSPLPPSNTSTNGTKSIVNQLAPGDDNDGQFDINEFDYHINALILRDVLAADPKGPVSILADGTRPATVFEPDDAQWVALARKLSGQALPLPSAQTEQRTYQFLKSLGTARLEKVLSYLIIPGITLTVLGPPTITQTAYITANGETLLIKSNFGVVTLVDNNSLTSNSGVVEGAMNAGNKQIAWSSAVLLPAKF